MYRTNQKGFTLIELLVVIAIIGILSSVVLASLNTARQKSRDARRVSDAKQLQLALELYYDANGNYPSDISASTLVDNGYIASIPLDPQSESTYPYAVNSDGSNYHIGTNLEQDDHQALDSDVDATPSGAFDGTTSGLTGDDTNDCSGSSGAACYDMQP